MRSILIIDDEDDIREVAALSLEATAGWKILTASSGAEGIEIAQKEQPDAILMDVMMPGSDGPTTYRAMQEIPAISHIPVLLLTAKVQGVDKRRFADLGDPRGHRRFCVADLIGGTESRRKRRTHNGIRAVCWSSTRAQPRLHDPPLSNHPPSRKTRRGTCCSDSETIWRLED